MDPLGLLEFEIEGDKAFQAQVKADIARIDSKPVGHAAMQELRDSPFRNVIMSGTENKNIAHDRAGASNGKGSGSTTLYNPKETESGADTSGNTKRPAFIGLAHELAGHGVEKTRGTHKHDYAVRKYDNKIPRAERGAVEAENKVRAEHGLLPRRDYELLKKK
jgi:hypothetical protein